jgi:hypothetical protein
MGEGGHGRQASPLSSMEIHFLRRLLLPGKTHNAGMSSFSRRHFLSLLGAGLAAGSASRLHAADATEPAWKSLFDGKTLEGWKITDFSGRADVKVEDGKIILEPGNDLTGITYAGEPPKMNYEVSLEATRLSGDDFFCGLTFPVGDACVTYVLGGWGGGVAGISSINGMDASENDTTKFLKFDTNKWYRVRVRVTPKVLEAFLDDESMAKVELQDKKLGMRAGEIELSQPFGIASFRTKAALREIKLRKLA